MSEDDDLSWLAREGEWSQHPTAGDEKFLLQSSSLEIDSTRKDKIMSSRPQPQPQKGKGHETKVISVAVPDVNNFVPGHTEGDTDFDGNGPSVYISADVKRKANQLVLAVYAIFQETKS